MQAAVISVISAFYIWIFNFGSSYNLNSYLFTTVDFGEGGSSVHKFSSYLCRMDSGGMLLL